MYVFTMLSKLTQCPIQTGASSEVSQRANVIPQLHLHFVHAFCAMNGTRYKQLALNARILLAASQETSRKERCFLHEQIIEITKHN
jgi:hypothetical protein